MLQALQFIATFAATLLQAPLAVLSFLSGAGAWLLGGDVGWFVAALLIGMVVPFTFAVVMPTNRQLSRSWPRSGVSGDALAAGEVE